MISQELYEYFAGDELACKVGLEKYALRDAEGNVLENTPNDTFIRLASEFERIEKKKYTEVVKEPPLKFETIFNLLNNFKYIIPGGSAISGIGNNHSYTSLSNCFVVDCPEDSYGSIFNSEEQITQASKRRGGTGIDISKLRPRNTKVTNSARTSSGAVSFMKRFSNCVNETGQGGRRAALMISIDVNHPDVLDFINAKSNNRDITGANISVKITDEFMNAVINNEEYLQTFNLILDNKGNTETYNYNVNAKLIGDAIIKNATDHAEPGVMFGDTFKRNSISDCYADEGFAIVTTNPCSEIALSEKERCCLMSLNLLSYVDNPFTENSNFNFELFSEHTRLAVRLNDDVTDLDIEKVDNILEKINRDPGAHKSNEMKFWEGVQKKAIQGRRLGIGVTALADCLAALGLRYDSQESINMINRIFDTFQYSLFKSSIEISRLLGPFHIFDFEKEKNCPYLQDLYKRHPDLEADTKKYGRRNITLGTIAPTGSISICAQTTSGIEPLFQKTYSRRKKVNKEPGHTDNKKHYKDEEGTLGETFDVTHKGIEQNTNASDIYIEAKDIDGNKRVEIQSVCQHYICNSISSTINLPKGTSYDKVADIYMAAYKSGCKGITVYVDGSRDGVLIDITNKRDIGSSGVIKRPKVVDCDNFNFKFQNLNYMLLIGFLDGGPYECFLGNETEGAPLPKEIKNAVIYKEKKGKYYLIGDDINNGKVKALITDDTLSPNIASICRLTSTLMRHNVPIEVIVEQLEKINGFNSIPKLVSRGLKKYIKNGSLVNGRHCPDCNEILVRENGCMVCKNCGYSVCN